MHSGELELTKLTYARLEDNLIRHWGDRYTSAVTFALSLGAFTYYGGKTCGNGCLKWWYDDYSMGTRSKLGFCGSMAGCVLELHSCGELHDMAGVHHGDTVSSFSTVQKYNCDIIGFWFDQIAPMVGFVCTHACVPQGGTM